MMDGLVSYFSCLNIILMVAIATNIEISILIAAITVIMHKRIIFVFKVSVTSFNLKIVLAD